MRKLILLFAISLLVGLFGCSKRHNDLTFQIPITPIITSADLSPSEDSVHLVWDFEDHDLVDEYRVYVGIYLTFGQSVYDTVTLAQITPDRDAHYDDPGLALMNEQVCELLNLCGPTHEITQFRVTAVIDGVEGVASERVFPTP